MNGIRWKTFSRLDYIGARSSILNKPRRVGAVAKGTVLLYQLSKEQFL